jgi:hypothetical protein
MRRMDPHRFRGALAALGITQKALADLLDLGDRTVRHYASEGVSSGPVMILIYLLLTHKITIEDIEDIADARKEGR